MPVTHGVAGSSPVRTAFRESKTKKSSVINNYRAFLLWEYDIFSEQEAEWETHYIRSLVDAERSFLVGGVIVDFMEVGSNFVQAEFIAEVKKETPDADS